MNRAYVIGSGPNGLAAAIVLAQAGLRVEVFEAEAEPGGAARTMPLTLPGFLHDFGSAVHPFAAGSPFFSTLPLKDYGLEWILAEALAHPLDDGLLVDAREIAEVGIVEVIKHIPLIYRRFREVVREAERRRPDAAVLIDFPDFNLRLARELHQLGVPVIYYVSPQLWAWKQSRIERVRKYVRKMLVIFPFEERFYRERGIEAQFVGHPLADLPSPQVTREQFAAQHKLDPAREWIALLPGSRRGEVSRIFPTLLEAAQLLGPEYVYIVPVASTLDAGWVAAFLRDMITAPQLAQRP